MMMKSFSTACWKIVSARLQRRRIPAPAKKGPRAGARAGRELPQSSPPSGINDAPQERGKPSSVATAIRCGAERGSIRGSCVVVFDRSTTDFKLMQVKV
jgi:hypothetical protein